MGWLLLLPAAAALFCAAAGAAEPPAAPPPGSARLCVPQAADAALLRVAAIAADRLGRVTGGRVPVTRVAGWSGLGLALCVGDASDAAVARVLNALPKPPADPEGFQIRSSPAAGIAAVAAGSPLGCLHGAGRLLASLEWTGARPTLPQLERAETPTSPLRSIYFAIHFNNWYENCADAELVRVVEDLGLFGINAVWTWYNFERYADPFDEATAGTPEGRLAREAWRKHEVLLEAAHALGMRCGYLTCSNLLYVNQAAAHPEWQAKPHGSGGITPRHVCPSIPEARALLLKNHAEIFRRRSHIDLFCDWPYDWGGCGCEKCQPYVRTYATLAAEKVRLLRERWPKAQVWLSDWHFSDAEADWLAAWSRTPEAAWVQGLMKDDRHPWDRFTRRKLRPDVAQAAFLDLTMVGAWGVMGANPLPKRLGRIAGELQRQGIRGTIGYTEGIYDEANKYLMARLSWDPGADTAALLREYAALRFGPAAAPTAKLLARLGDQWANELASWSGVGYRFDTGAARETSALLAQAEEALAGRPDLRESDAFRIIALRARIDTEVCALQAPQEGIRASLANLQGSKDARGLREGLNQALDLLARNGARLRALDEAQAELHRIYRSQCWLPENALPLDSWLKRGIGGWPRAIASLEGEVRAALAAPDAELPACVRELLLRAELRDGAAASSRSAADTGPEKALDGRGYTLFEGAWSGTAETFWCAARGEERDAWWMTALPSGTARQVSLLFRRRHWDGSNTYFALPRSVVVEVSDDAASWRAVGRLGEMPAEGSPYRGPVSIPCEARGKWLRLRFPEGAQKEYLELVEVTLR